MRGAFSLIGLLVVVAVVGLVAKKQLQAVGLSGSPGPASTAVGSEASPTGAAAAPRQRVEQVSGDVQRALQAGAAARASDAER